MVGGAVRIARGAEERSERVEGGVGVGGCQCGGVDSAEGALKKVKKQSWNVRIVGLGVEAASCLTRASTLVVN
jgi:hypothetical protein